MGRALAIQGTSSWAGKSLITTALARSFFRRGVHVAPFKAQNMSNNARVVVGGEIGVAQYLQALACGIEPDVRMNPVLVKPEGDTRSQVVVCGVADQRLSRMEWRQRAPLLWSAIEESLRSLLEEFDLVLVEGAGSPAEINLRDTDLANMRSADTADAPVLLVADIDRGGAFAHLYGTWALLTAKDRGRIQGFVLNKFRGDQALLPPGPQRLQQLTGVPVLGVVPWLEHGLPDEDGAAASAARGKGPRVAIIRYPTASNLDEFRAIAEVADVSWVLRPDQIEAADLVILPGSKHVAGDLQWLRATGLGARVIDHAGAGGRVLGVCGGLQLLGEEMVDVGGVDGSGRGLALLPLVTAFAREKLTRRNEACFAAGLPRPWEALAGLAVGGYEIRHGHTHASAPVIEALPEGLGYTRGSVLGVYLHGLFEQPRVVDALLGVKLQRTLERVFDQLADVVESSLERDRLDQLAGLST
jgi:adenosylcobyric acid synthase